MRTCSKCKQSKPEIEFYARSKPRQGFRSWCRSCEGAIVRLLRVRDPAKVRALWHRHEYGLTPERYAELLEQQAGACAICWQVKSKTLCVDHDHETGKIRALICDGCNVMLGRALDNPAVLRCAADYLEEHNSQADRAVSAEIVAARA